LGAIRLLGSAHRLFRGEDEADTGKWEEHVAVYEPSGAVQGE
jgi:hypothetical protein